MIRFGVIGTSWITKAFIESAQEISDFKLNAVYSRKKEVAEEFGKAYGVSMIFTDIEKMAKSDMIDAVYIASPNAMHARQAEIFLKNGKHVLCEKPVTSTVEELEKNIELSNKYQLAFMEALTTSFLPNFNAIKENLYKIGLVRRYFASYCQYSSRYDRYKAGEKVNTFNPEFSSGSLMDLGIYCIYPLVNLFGMPQTSHAKGILLPSGVDGEGSISFDYGDMDGIVLHSKISNGSNISEIQGENGTIVINKIGAMEQVHILYNDGHIEDITRSQKPERMYYEALEFIELIKLGKIESDINTHELSLNVMKILEKSRREMAVVYPADKNNI